jgi:hypothetical protein
MTTNSESFGFGENECYAILEYAGQERIRTDYVSDDDTPYWNKCATFWAPLAQKIKVQLWEHDGWPNAHDDLGTYEKDALTLTPGKSTYSWSFPGTDNTIKVTIKTTGARTTFPHH